eukprot:CAMPEP_0184541098 /NCGR_PEP_ID=MMETSP0199_2-20130426/1181_1 /TAXON_ID=1112570 /ORGANISM="Thraustochytrium sp., Strain LLF1b" /LENGTH=884 /DNA_ID=CAMNT_0026934805 /DNA_START=42 /DNA_END=2696 /DNA_ORIENTATION=-
MGAFQGLVALVAGVLALLGVGLSYSFAMHDLLGFGSLPYEAMEEVNMVAMVASVSAGPLAVLAAGLLAGGFSGFGSFVTLEAIVAGVVAFRTANESLVFNLDLLAGAVALLVATLVLGVAGSSNAKKSTSMLPVTASIVVLAAIFKLSMPEGTCFAQVDVPTPLAVNVNENFLFGEGFHLATNTDDNSFTVTHNGKVVFAAVPGTAFIAAAMSGSFDAPNNHEMGIYDFQDLATNFTGLQSIDAVTKIGSDEALVRGKVADHTGYPMTYKFRLSSRGAGQLDWNAALSSLDITRIYVKMSSHRKESIFGMGLQYTYSDLKGGCVPVFTMEQGITRGLQPFTFIINMFLKHASGSWQTSYAPVPYFLTSDLRSVYLHNSAFSLFDFSKPDEITIEVNDTEAIGTVLVGDSPLELIEAYTEKHAGRMRPLPDWTGKGAIVGLQGGTDKVRKHVDALKAAKVPLAGLWLQDWTGKRETDFGRRLQWNWELQPKQYPGWAEYIKELSKEEIYVMSYINPYVANTGGPSGESISLFQEASKIDCLVKNSDGVTVQIQASATPDFTYGTVDLTNPRCRTWYIEDVIRSRMLGDTESFDDVKGVMGFMADFAESVSMGVKFHAGEGSLIHNDFPVMWSAACREAIKKNKFLEENAVFFSRAAGAKSPGETTLMWMGDQMTTFDHYDGLRSALQGILSGGISGFSLAHSDIGGYTMLVRFGGLVKVSRSAELFMRWAEMNVFSDAVFRTHEGNNPDISVQAVNDEVSAHFAKFATLHNKLFHLVKKPLMKVAAETGAPLARHMFLHYPNDVAAWKARDQFMLGDQLLVCPIVEKGALSRMCYVPEGGWRHVFTGETPKAGASFLCQAPIGQPCVLFRPGAEDVAAVIRETLA